MIVLVIMQIFSGWEVWENSKQLGQYLIDGEGADVTDRQSVVKGGNTASQQDLKDDMTLGVHHPSLPTSWRRRRQPSRPHSHDDGDTSTSSSDSVDEERQLVGRGDPQGSHGEHRCSDEEVEAELRPDGVVEYVPKLQVGKRQTRRKSGTRSSRSKRTGGTDHRRNRSKSPQEEV